MVQTEVSDSRAEKVRIGEFYLLAIDFCLSVDLSSFVSLEIARRATTRTWTLRPTRSPDNRIFQPLRSLSLMEEI
jgi:hypothetical protein